MDDASDQAAERTGSLVDLRDVVLVFIGAVAGAVVDRLAGPIAAVTTRLFWRIRAAIVLDHRTISRATVRNDHGGRAHIHLNMACAPSRGWPSPRRIDVAGIHSWVREHFGDLFNEPDFVSPTELIRYRDEHCPNGASVALLNIRPDGLVEHSLPLNHRPLDDTDAALSIVELGAAVAAFVQSVHDGAYQSGFGLKKAPKLDWFFGVSQALYIEGKGSVPWKELEFPGRQPEPRPAEMHPPVFGRGLAEEDLRGVPPGADAVLVCRKVLIDLAERNGYRSFDAAIEDAILAIRGRPELSHTTDDGPPVPS